MNPLLWIFQFVFECRHRHTSRVFTITTELTAYASTADGSLICPDPRTRRGVKRVNPGVSYLSALGMKVLDDASSWPLK